MLVYIPTTVSVVHGIETGFNYFNKREVNYSLIRIILTLADFRCLKLNWDFINYSGEFDYGIYKQVGYHYGYPLYVWQNNMRSCMYTDCNHFHIEDLTESVVSI